MEEGLSDMTEKLTHVGDVGTGGGGTPRQDGILLPEDLLVDQLMVRLDWASVGRLARCCTRLRALTDDDKLWHRLAHAALGDACMRLTSSSNWRRTGKELCTLSNLSWERKPKPDCPAVWPSHLSALGARRGEPRSSPKVWPRGRWGHTVTVLDKDSFIIFGGECNGATNDVHVYDCTNSEWRLVRCEGKYPCARFGHACVLYGHSTLLFGGSGVLGAVCAKCVCVCCVCGVLCAMVRAARCRSTWLLCHSETRAHARTHTHRTHTHTHNTCIC